MKKITSLAAALLIVIGTAFANGNETESKRATVLKGSEDVFKVIYAENTSGTVIIRLYSEEGNLIRKDRVINKRGFMKPYDLSKLKDGGYYFELKDEQGVITRNISLEKPAAIKTVDDSRILAKD